MVKGDSAKVQIGAELLCKSAKVDGKNRWGRGRIDYRVRSTDYRVEARTSGRDAVAPLPAGGARERQLGWHAVPTLPRYN